jgi:uncharacterized membrane protein YkvA (DUF1232 family)
VTRLLALLPRLARMLASLMGDREVPTAAKIALAAVALYLASPIDLIPDFIPFLGIVDDVLVVAVIVDGLLTYVDRRILERYWPGDVASLDTVASIARRLARWVPARVKARLFGGLGRAA